MVTTKELELLRAPLVDAEVDWRASRCGTGAKGKYAFLVPYLNRIEIIDRRLDGILGPDNWKNEVLIQEGGVVSTIWILVGDTWIPRTDGAGYTDYEGFKGGISDAFKRAAVLWGIGRELYRVKEVGVFGQQIHDGYAPNDGGYYVNLQAKARGNSPAWYGWIRKPSIEGFRKIQKQKEEEREATVSRKTGTAPPAGKAPDPVGDSQVPPDEDGRFQGDESAPPEDSYNNELDIF